MGTHQLGNGSAPGYVDKRRLSTGESESRIVTGDAVFTANATGTTTTIVGANATPSTGANVVRPNEKFKLFNVTTGTLKEETVFRITEIAVAASTTVTFTPAAAVAPISGDTMKLVGNLSNQFSHGERDFRLSVLGFSAGRIASMTENDKLYQIRISDDPGSL